MAAINKLSAKQVVTLPVGLHGDGGNLYLSVRPGGSRQWVMRYRVDKRQRELGLGGAGPGRMSLADARAKAETVRAQLRNGEDPLVGKAADAEVKVVLTFRAEMEDYLTRQEAGISNDDHVVPLQDDAMEILHLVERLRATGKGGELLFPNENMKALSLAALDQCRERMGVYVTTHGFRSTFRTWVTEETFHEDAIAEKAIAHMIGDEVRRAYNRGSLLQKRRVLMNDWADQIIEDLECPGLNTLAARANLGAIRGINDVE